MQNKNAEDENISTIANAALPSSKFQVSTETGNIPRHAKFRNAKDYNTRKKDDNNVSTARIVDSEETVCRKETPRYVKAQQRSSNRSNDENGKPKFGDNKWENNSKLPR